MDFGEVGVGFLVRSCLSVSVGFCSGFLWFDGSFSIGFSVFFFFSV